MAKPLLFEPFQVRKTTFSNRLWISPMCQYQATDGFANDWHFVHYGSLARGGAGLVMVEATGIAPEGRITPGCLGIWDDKHVEGLKKIADLAHKAGTKIGIQLGHAGRKASAHRALPGEPEGTVPANQGGWQSVGPSPEPFTGLASPKELTLADIEDLNERFSAAAKRAVEAGFDVLEIHAAHGYLLSSFLSPLANKRRDDYGGSLQNRARFLLSVVRRIRSENPETPLFVRLSASDWLAGGSTPEEARSVASYLRAEGVDLVDVSSAGNVLESPVRLGPSYQSGFAATVKEAGLPVSAVGLITSPEQAESLLVTGVTDVCMIGREALRNPATPISWAKTLRVSDVTDLAPPSYFRAWR